MNRTGSRGAWGIVLLLLGLGCIILAVFLYQQDQAFARIAKTATGTVIDFKKIAHETTPGSINTGYTYTYAPIIKFVTSTGQAIQFTTPGSQNPPAYQIGDPVDVLYDPQNPNNAEIPGGNNLLFLVIGGLGFIWVVTGVIMTVYAFVPS